MRGGQRSRPAFVVPDHREERHASSHLQRIPPDRRRRPTLPDNHRPDRRDRARHPRLRLRLGPLVLPWAQLSCGRLDRARVHRNRRGRRSRRRRTRAGRSRRRSLPVQRRHLRPLSRGLAVAVRQPRGVRARSERRRSGRGRARPVRRQHARTGPWLRTLGRDDEVAARAFGRHGHRPSRRRQRRCEAGHIP